MGAYWLFQDVKNNKPELSFRPHVGNYVSPRYGALIALLRLWVVGCKMP